MTNEYIEQQLLSINKDVALISNKMDTLITAVQLNKELSNNRVLNKKELSKEIEVNNVFVNDDHFKNNGEFEIARRIGEHLKQYDNFRQYASDDNFKEQLTAIVQRKEIPEKEFITCLKRVNDTQGVKNIKSYTYASLNNIEQ